MKPYSPALLAIFLALTPAALADPPVNPDFGNGHFVKTFPPANEKAWTVAGDWFVTHTVWSGPLTFKPDGLIYNPKGGLEGQWILATESGEVHLIIRWNKWTADNLSMLANGEFYGSDGRSEIWLHRLPAAAASANAGRELGGAVEFHTWQQGEPPVKLIRRDEGFCALTRVTGNFRGYGETVRVYISDDGYWYLGGDSQQNDVTADCIVVRYQNPPHAGQKVDEAPLASPTPPQ